VRALNGVFCIGFVPEQSPGDTIQRAMVSGRQDLVRADLSAPDLRDQFVFIHLLCHLRRMLSKRVTKAFSAGWTAILQRRRQARVSAGDAQTLPPPCDTVESSSSV